MSEPDPENLSALLRRWKVRPEVPRDFQRDVWQRISTRQAARDEAISPLDSLLRLFIRPAFALAIVTLSATAGVALAREKASHVQADAWKALEDRYADSINPLAQHLEFSDHQHHPGPAAAAPQHAK